MKIEKTMWLAVAMVALMWIVSAWYYPQLPETVPIHWNSQGIANDFMDKPWGALLMPLISSGVLLLLFILPVLSPKGFRLDSAKRAYGIVVSIIMAFMLAVLVLSYEHTLGKVDSFSEWISAGLGVLLVVLGNYLSKFPKNFWVGIRTPWTLASDEVWFKTHRLGGRTFMAGGLLVFLGSFAGIRLEYLVGIVLVAAFTPVVYSLVIYKRMHGFSPGEDE